MKDYVLAHDLGTTGNKATLYDREGYLVGSAFYGYETEYAHTSWAEQNPEDWWLAVCASTHELLQKARVRSEEVACVVFSGQMMGCVAVDRNGKALRKAIIWADQRSVEQERKVRERVSAEEVYRITGHRLSASYSLCKILWLRDHQPDVYKGTYRFVHAKDAIVARLTGVFVTDPSDASGMNLYDLEQSTWSDRIIEATEIDPGQLPEVHRSIDVVGGVLSQVADEIGLPAGTPVVVGGGDGSCAAAGAGVLNEGTAYNYIGSSSWIALAAPRPIYDPDHRTFTWCHVVPGMYAPTGTMQAAGASYQWTRNQLCPEEVRTAEMIAASAYDVMNDAAERSSIGANGLIFLPYLLGERSPHWNPRARGAFIGLTVRHTRADMIRAVLEGVTMNLRVILDAFRSQGTEIDSMRLIGGGARGRFWNRLMADIYGVPVHRLAIIEEATSMGAALVGGVGVGLYPDFSMIEKMNQTMEIIEPDPTAQKAYEDIYAIFETAYQALVPIFDRMGEVFEKGRLTRQ
jgi:xylulokinase